MTSRRSEKLKVGIAPGVAALRVLSAIPYRPWFALAEFVDNSIQSYLDHRKEIERADGKRHPLRVDIELTSGTKPSIKIVDTAGGIALSDYKRAFRAAEPPPNSAGLSEFGMGMKTASCWFASRWAVRSGALGESVERTITFDIDKIVEENIEDLFPVEHGKDVDAHFTTVYLEDLHHEPKGPTIAKIKEHLKSIYRCFLRDGTLELSLKHGGKKEVLRYVEPGILCAPFFEDPRSEKIEWKKDISFDLGNGMSVHGFAGLRDPGSWSKSGFALFRRNRLIMGSLDEAYKPAMIFGHSSSYRNLRLFGELHLEGFEVSHTKDGFKWDDNEEPFLELLKDHLNSKPMRLLDQAEGHRERLKAKELREAAERALENTAKDLKAFGGSAIQSLLVTPEQTASPSVLPKSSSVAAKRSFDIVVSGDRWDVTIDILEEDLDNDWLQVADTKVQGDVKRVHLRIAGNHPFMMRFCGTNDDRLEIVTRLAAAIGISEVIARLGGRPYPEEFRDGVNELLLGALAGPDAQEN